MVGSAHLLTDDRKTWTQPKLLNDDNPSELAVQVTPNIDVTPDGRVDAVWWDFRDDTGAIATDVYYTFSTDNGDSAGAGNDAARYALGAVIGLAVVGLVLLALSFAARSGTPAPAPFDAKAATKVR